MTDPIKLAQMILAEAGNNRLPRCSPEDLAALARDYLARSGGAATLGQTGRLYVSLAAAREYADAERIAGDEEARRELHELLLDARQDATDPTSWRMRRRSEDLDVTARVAEDGRLLVVTHVSVRPANLGGRRG